MELNDKKTDRYRIGTHTAGLYCIILLYIIVAPLCWAETQAKPNTLQTVPPLPYFINSLGMKFIHVPAGTFKMRTPLPMTQPLSEAYPRARGFLHPYPARDAEVEKDLYISEFEVTNSIYRQFVRETGHPSPEAQFLDIDRIHHGTITIWDKSEFNPDDQPVVGLLHPDAVKFCEWISKKDHRTYRLPTVTEWEYACRAGTESDYYWGQTADPRKCNYQSSRINHTLPVGSYEPNPWGLYDMIGNAAEVTDSLWADLGRYYIKGGSWCHPWWWLDASSYMALYSPPGPSQYSATVGLRLACDSDQAASQPADLTEPLIRPAKQKHGITAKLKIEISEPVDLGRAPINEASLLACWDPAAGPNSPRNIWILWNKRSTDSGQTWKECSPLPHMAVQLRDGTVIAIGAGAMPHPDENGRFTFQISKDAWQTVQTVDGVIQGTKCRKAGLALHQGLIEMQDDTLLMSCYGTFEGDMEHEDYCGGFMIEENFHKVRSVLLESKDRGHTWTFRSTIANYPSYTREGCDEPDIVLLPKGDLFCIMRTGLADCPMFCSWSRSQGRSWSDFDYILVKNKKIEGIFPRIVLLDNGVLAFLRSRPGTSVVFCSDASGSIWTDEVSLYEHRGAMNALRAIGPDRLLAVYVDENKHYIMQTITVNKH